MTQAQSKHDDFIHGLPKAELHLHIEGSLEPEMMFQLAKRNKVALPFACIEEVQSAYSFSNLQDFLDLYYQGAGVLLTEQDFFDLTKAYFTRIHADQVRHAEIFFDPQTHTERGLPFQVAIEGILAGMKAAEVEYGISSKLIMSFLRHLDEASAFATLEMAEPWLDKIVAVGLDSSEVGHPPEKFARVFRESEKLGLLKVAHAGEEGPPQYIYEALDILTVHRIDHGNRSMEDPHLIKRLASSGMTLTVCPLSNLKLCVVNDMRLHPIGSMLKHGLRATVNSDDPAYFGGYINENYKAIASAGVVDRDGLIELARNSFLGSFLSHDEVRKHMDAIEAYVATCQSDPR